MLLTVLPPQWIFYIQNQQYLNLQFVDGTTLDAASPTYVDDLTVTATLYSGRNAANPSGTPGAQQAQWLVPRVPASDGRYQVLIPASFNPPLGLSYVLVIDAPLSPSGYSGHWEFPAAVVTRQS